MIRSTIYRKSTQPTLGLILQIISMDNSFCIEFAQHTSGALFGLFAITMRDTKMSYQTFNELIEITQSGLDYILSHLNQEGELDEDMFCQIAYNCILETKDRIASFFGEDAVVTLDRNIEFYRDTCMDLLFRSSLQLTIGAPVFSDINRYWKHEPIKESTMEYLVELLTGAEVM